MATITVKDANGVLQTAARVTATGQATSGNSLPVVLANDVGSQVKTSRTYFRDAFFFFDTTNNWDLVSTGAGQTITCDGITAGSRYLNIDAGVTAAAETVILSKDIFYLPLKLSVAVSLSQRIANNNFYIELVGCDVDGVVDTNSTYTSPESSQATNNASIRWSGTTAANAFYIARSQGAAELISSTSAFGTTAATGTTPDFIPAFVYDIMANNEEVVFSSRAIDSSNASTVVGKRNVSILNPNKGYKVRIRVLNGTTPATATNFRVHTLVVQDDYRLSVDLGRYSGRVDASEAIPVSITNQPGVSGAITAGAGGYASAARLPASAATTNATLVKSSTGRVYQIDCHNATASIKYLKLYNKASAPTVGTDTPFLTFALSPNSKFYVQYNNTGVSMPLGIAYAITGGAADADTTAVALNDIVGLNIVYA